MSPKLVNELDKSTATEPSAAKTDNTPAMRSETRDTLRRELREMQAKDSTLSDKGASVVAGAATAIKDNLTSVSRFVGGTGIVGEAGAQTAGLLRDVVAKATTASADHLNKEMSGLAQMPGALVDTAAPVVNVVKSYASALPYVPAELARQASQAVEGSSKWYGQLYKSAGNLVGDGLKSFATTLGGDGLIGRAGGVVGGIIASLGTASAAGIEKVGSVVAHPEKILLGSLEVTNLVTNALKSVRDHIVDGIKTTATYFAKPFNWIGDQFYASAHACGKFVAGDGLIAKAFDGMGYVAKGLFHSVGAIPNLALHVPAWGLQAVTIPLDIISYGSKKAIIASKSLISPEDPSSKLDLVKNSKPSVAEVKAEPVVKKSEPAPQKAVDPSVSSGVDSVKPTHTAPKPEVVRQPEPVIKPSIPPMPSTTSPETPLAAKREALSIAARMRMATIDAKPETTVTPAPVLEKAVEVQVPSVETVKETDYSKIRVYDPSAKKSVTLEELVNGARRAVIQAHSAAGRKGGMDLVRSAAKVDEAAVIEAYFKRHTVAGAIELAPGTLVKTAFVDMYNDRYWKKAA